MGYDLEGKEKTLGVDRPELAVMQDDASEGSEEIKYPTVSVIIPTYTAERWDWVCEAVASAQNQTVPALEIIVVVDHNPELLERITREIPGVITVPNIGGQGVSGARNSGVKASRGEVVAFLDDDSIASPDWLATLLRHIVKPDVVGVGCYSDGLWDNPCPSWFPPEFSWAIGVSYSGLPSKPTAVRNVWTSAMLVKRSAFEIVDGFRENFGKIGNRSLPEDTDLCLRIASVHDKAVWMWDPAKVMQHRIPAGRTTFRYLLSRCFLQGWGKAAMAHMDGFEQSTSLERHYALRILPVAVVRGVADAFRGDFAGIRRAGAIVVALAFTLAGYFWFVLERRRRHFAPASLSPAAK